MKSLFKTSSPRRFFSSAGVDATAARVQISSGIGVPTRQRAIGALRQTLIQQSTLLTNADAYRWLALVCVLCCRAAAALLKKARKLGPTNGNVVGPDYQFKKRK
jgi:hypothetical protein